MRSSVVSTIIMYGETINMRTQTFGFLLWMLLSVSCWSAFREWKLSSVSPFLSVDCRVLCVESAERAVAVRGGTRRGCIPAADGIRGYGPPWGDGRAAQPPATQLPARARALRPSEHPDVWVSAFGGRVGGKERGGWL